MGVDRLIGGPRRAGLPAAMRGTVVVPPADPNDGMRVVANNYSQDWDYDIPAQNWVIKGARLPDVGDSCLIFLDDEDDAWVLVGSA